MSGASISATLENYVYTKCMKHCVDQETLITATRMAADNFDLDYRVILAIIAIESGFILAAKNHSSVGLMQVHLRYHKEKFKHKNPLGAYDNIFVGSSILKDCMTRSKNNLDKAFRCYNGNGSKGYSAKAMKTLAEIKKLELSDS